MNIENIVAITLAISYILGPIVTLRLGLVQAKSQEKDETEKRLDEASAMDKFSESWDRLLDAKQEELDALKNRYTEEIERWKQRYSEREQELMEDISALTIRVDNLEKERQQLTQTVERLNRQFRQIKKETGELKAETEQRKKENKS